MPLVTRPNGTAVGEITDPQELAYYRSVGYRIADPKPATRPALTDSPAPSVPAETSLDLDTDKENQE